MKTAEKILEVDAPQTSGGRVRNNNLLTTEVIQYLEEKNDLREFFTKKTFGKELSKSYPVEKKQGRAVHLIGNAEIPKQEDVKKFITAFTAKMALPEVPKQLTEAEINDRRNEIREILESSS